MSIHAISPAFVFVSLTCGYQAFESPAFDTRAETSGLVLCDVSATAFSGGHRGWPPSVTFYEGRLGWLTRRSR